MGELGHNGNHSYVCFASINAEVSFAKASHCSASPQDTGMQISSTNSDVSGMAKPKGKRRGGITWLEDSSGKLQEQTQGTSRLLVPSLFHHDSYLMPSQFPATFWCCCRFA